MLTALDAEVIAHDGKAERRIPVRELMSGLFETALRSDKILTTVRVPRLSAAARFRYHKICRYALHAVDDGTTRVEIEIGYTLTGTPAQFSRGTIATDLVRRLTAAFAKNLEARIAGGGTAGTESETAGGGTQALDAGGLLGAVLWTRFKS